MPNQKKLEAKVFLDYRCGDSEKIKEDFRKAASLLDKAKIPYYIVGPTGDFPSLNDNVAIKYGILNYIGFMDIGEFIERFNTGNLPKPD